MYQNGSGCTALFSTPLLRIICATNVVSALVCLLAAILVFFLRLYRKVVYRLALYQVLSSLCLAVLATTQIVFVYYNGDSSYKQGCTAIAFLSLYAQWMTLLFTFSAIQHLFCFGALHNNLRRCEVLYVLTSLLLPAPIALVAYIVKSYGPGEFGCWIYETQSVVNCTNDTLDGNKSTAETQFFKRLGFWDGPASTVLLVASAAMVAMVIKLSCKVYQRKRYGPIVASDDQFGKALKQLLPLAAFPILFCVFVIQQFAFHIYQFLNHPPKAMFLITSISFSMWSFASGLTLIFHICVARRYCNDLHQYREMQGRGETGRPAGYGATIDEEGCTTVRQETRSTTLTSATHYSIPISSGLRDEM
eukprot:Em0007g403a